VNTGERISPAGRTHKLQLHSTQRGRRRKGNPPAARQREKHKARRLGQAFKRSPVEPRNRGERESQLCSKARGKKKERKQDANNQR